MDTSNIVKSSEDAVSKEGEGQAGKKGIYVQGVSKRKDAMKLIGDFTCIYGRAYLFCLMSINSFGTETLYVYTLHSQCLHTSQLLRFDKYFCPIRTHVLFWSLPVIPALLFLSGLRDGRVAGRERQTPVSSKISN